MASKKQTEVLLEQERQRSTARSWKSRSIGDDVEVPSGNVALIRRVGPEAFLSSGTIPDALAPIIDEAIRSGKGLPPEKVKESANDPKQIAQMMEMMDNVVCMAVIEPKVDPIPLCVSHKSGEECALTRTDPVHTDRSSSNWHVFTEGDRDEDSLYVDEVDFEDKNFIFQYALGGTRDLERFRKEQAESVESLSDS